MMYLAAKYVRDELNLYLSGKVSASTDIVMFGSIHEPDGTISTKITDKIVITLVNVERENVLGRAPAGFSKSGSEAENNSAPINLNLYLLVLSLIHI